MRHPHYTLRKTYAALQQITTSARAILHSKWLDEDESEAMYEVYEKADMVERKFRWDNLEALEPESYKIAVENGMYERYKQKPLEIK